MSVPTGNAAGVGEANREGSMRGEDRTDGALFSYVDIEARIPAKHPLRAMRRLTNAALAELDGAFSALYEACGRPSIPAERLLRASRRSRAQSNNGDCCLLAVAAAPVRDPTVQSQFSVVRLFGDV